VGWLLANLLLVCLGALFVIAAAVFVVWQLLRRRNRNVPDDSDFLDAAAMDDVATTSSII
jgi:heme/copper-type cytochrome/quinol oxidase subunit 2